MSDGFLRTPDGTWRAPWRVAAFGVAVAASGLVVGGVILGVTAATPLAGWARAARVPMDQVASLAAVLVATWVTVRQLHGAAASPWAMVGLGRDAWRVRAVVIAGVVGALTVLVPTGVLLATGQLRFDAASATDSHAMVAWAALALLLPAAFIEEVLFRGYLFTTLTDGLGTAGAVVSTSVLFAAAHLFNPDPSVATLAAVATAGAFLAAVRVATGSLIAATVAHLMVNYAQAVVVHAPVSGIALQTPGYRAVATGPAWLTGGAWGPEAGVVAVGAFAVATFVYARLWKRRGRDTRTSTTTTTAAAP